MRRPDKWHRVWMGMARTIAGKSKDPSFAAGAVLVGRDDKRFLGTGYNGPAPAISDDFDWDDRELKRTLCSHAESNCLWFAAGTHGLEALRGAILYVNGKPCSVCMKECARAEVTEVVYDDTNPHQPLMIDAKEWAKTLEVACRGGIDLTPYSQLEKN